MPWEFSTFKVCFGVSLVCLISFFFLFSSSNNDDIKIINKLQTIVNLLGKIVIIFVFCLKICVFFFDSGRDLMDSVLQGLKPTKRDAYGRLILGDIITSVNGRKVTNGSDLYRALDQCEVGDEVLS